MFGFDTRFAPARARARVVTSRPARMNSNVIPFAKRILAACAAMAFLFALGGCAKMDSNPSRVDIATDPPVITGLFADKTQILTGGLDPATITCSATGGNLKYVWAVDLGEIIPQNATHSRVSFAGPACCVGEKTITCTVSNTLGVVSKTIVITVLDVVAVPEIISLETNKREISAAASETASLVCRAIGGHLHYEWRASRGILAVNPTDNSRVTYTATSASAGVRTITCLVSNEKGDAAKSVQITVKM